MASYPMAKTSRSSQDGSSSQLSSAPLKLNQAWTIPEAASHTNSKLAIPCNTQHPPVSKHGLLENNPISDSALISDSVLLENNPICWKITPLYPISALIFHLFHMFPLKCLFFVMDFPRCRHGAWCGHRCTPWRGPGCVARCQWRASAPGGLHDASWIHQLGNGRRKMC